jgi:hypothetical protein
VVPEARVQPSQPCIIEGLDTRVAGEAELLRDTHEPARRLDVHADALRNSLDSCSKHPLPEHFLDFH